MLLRIYKQRFLQAASQWHPAGEGWMLQLSHNWLIPKVDHHPQPWEIKLPTGRSVSPVHPPTPPVVSQRLISSFCLQAWTRRQQGFTSGKGSCTINSTPGTETPAEAVVSQTVTNETQTPGSRRQRWIKGQNTWIKPTKTKQINRTKDDGTSGMFEQSLIKHKESVIKRWSQQPR